MTDVSEIGEGHRADALIAALIVAHSVRSNRFLRSVSCSDRLA